MSQNKFQESLGKTIRELDPKLDPKETLIDVFKTYVAKMMEDNVSKNNGRLEADFLNQMKGFLITEFKDADVGDHNLSITAYSALFDDTIQEIFNESAASHEGENHVEMDLNRQLEVNKNAYQNEMVRLNKNGERVTKSGIILP